MAHVGIVIIGRNEGENLRNCLMSAVGKRTVVVYADSGSTDGSVDLARELGVAVVALDSSFPFTAARGRNAGFARLAEIMPNLEYVQFIDGDCELINGWLETASEFLKKNQQHAVVCGRLSERHPEKSIYNRMCDIEWNGSVGDILTCGGIFMVRVKSFLEVGGMDSTIPAGEEPEMCLRLRQREWLIARLENEMAWHDANLRTFREWWKRSVRSGCGSLDIYTRTRGQIFSVQVRRSRLWTIGWGTVLLFFYAVFQLVNAAPLLLIILAVALLYPWQIIRLAVRGQKKGLSSSEAIVYGCLMMISKWAEICGQISYLVHWERRKTK